MIKNYFKTALRNFMRNKVFSLINVLGLSIGISASLVIYLLVVFDFSFDKFEQNGANIYRVVSKTVFSGEPFFNSGVTSPLPDALQRELTGVTNIVPVRTWGDQTKVSVPVSGTDKPSVFKKQGNIVFTGENYFRMVTYQWIAGSPSTSLKEPYQAVLTESIARLYFPKLKPEEILGKTIILDDTINNTVTGIVKDLTQNTDFTFKTFISRVTLEKTTLKPADWDEWGSTTSDSQLFLELDPKAKQENINAQMDKILQKNRKPDPQDHSVTHFNLQPLSDLHFNERYGNFFDNHMAHRPTLYSLLAVAAFLLLLACINFINLSTAQAGQRAKEIGIRKTIGSSRKQLVIQFLAETFFLTFAATVLSILITPLLLKVFADFIPSSLHFDPLGTPGILLFLFTLIVVVSVLSGLYPALILSSFKPALVMKSAVIGKSGKTRSGLLRKGLTVAQFVIAQIFIIGTILVSKQISYSLNKDLGFKKDAVVYFRTNFHDTSFSKRLVLRDKLRAVPGIAEVSLSSDAPSSHGWWTSTMKYKDGKKEVETEAMVKIGDENYINLYKMKLLAGSNLRHSDTINSLVINETYSRLMGFGSPSQAIGNTINWDGKQQPIVGVVADFYPQSLHNALKPLVIASQISSETTFNIALQPQSPGSSSWKQTIAKMENTFREIYPNDDFEYHFLDESIAKFYTSEQNISRLLAWSTGLAIAISCMGLLGLVIYVTNQRTKEIGIRKVVGASVSQLVTLLSADFLKLIAIAFLIVLPAAWYGAHKWLENFAYKTSLSWWVFLLGGIIMLFIALVILLLRTIRAAVANPVNSLKTE